MARTAKKTKAPARKWAGTKTKPSRMKADKVATTKAPKEPVIPDTKDDLLTKIGMVLDEVDTLMANREDHTIHFGGWEPLLVDSQKAIEDLVWRLNRVLNPKEIATRPGAVEAIQETFGAEPGTVPPWSRPGTFLIWIGYIPCRCVWGGFAQRVADVAAADPKQKWFSPAGTVSATRAVKLRHQSPSDVFRTYLTDTVEARATKLKNRRAGYVDIGPAFNLLPLADVGRQMAEAELARPENAWLVAALKRGPVNPIPLPKHLHAVQMSLV